MFNEIIKQEREKKKISIQKLSVFTNIPQHILKKLEEGNIPSLPASVFIKGYFKKISEILEIDSEELWNIFLKEKDKFFKKNISNKEKLNSDKKYSKILKSFIFLIFILIIFFFVIQIKIFLLPPKIEIIEPKTDMITQQEYIIVSGKGKKNSYVDINGKEVYIGEKGIFQEKIYLNKGNNEIILTSENTIGKKRIITRTITRE
jgi:hypothetical protein